MMMDRHRGDQYPESHRNWQSATSPWSSDDPHQERNFDFDNHRGDFYDNGHQHHHYNRPYNHHNHNFNGEPNASIGSGDGNTGSAHSLSLPVRKRQLPHSGYGASPDCADGGSFVKLFVGSVPRTTTEDEIRSLFGEFGNIVEVVLLKDKRTGLQQECCFVKYAKLEEADRAIGALNSQYTFAGGVVPIKVRYAEGERERIGIFATQEFKLFVGGLNKQATKREVEEIFSAYGLVEDICFVRDEMKQNRGCGFIQFSRKDMAVAAINALHGTYFMRGCDQPMIVRFAFPKKPRTGDSRCNSRFEPPGFGPRFREPVARPSPYRGDPISGHVLHNASDPLSPKIVASCSQGGPTAVTSGPASASFLGNGLPSSAQQSPQTGSKALAVSSTSTASDLVVPSTLSSAPAMPTSTQMADPLDCDWSEHTCPDGYKYYYNCTTCESRWEKPVEYTYYEQQLQKQQQQQQPSCQELHSPSNTQVLSTEQVSPLQPVKLQTELSYQKLEQPSFSAVEIDHVHVPASPVIDPTCV